MPRQSRLVPLPAAAASAFQQLAAEPGRHAVLGERVLDVAAIALAACIPIYGERLPGQPPEPLSADELAAGEFSDGATRLTFADDKPPIAGLAVTPEDLRSALERLEEAGVSFEHAQFEPARRAPRGRAYSYMLG